MNRLGLCAALLCAGHAVLAAKSPQSQAVPSGGSQADLGQRPAGSGVKLLPDGMLRAWDPITVWFTGDESAGPGPADDGARRLSIEPPWPGAWSWLDRRTLQFRPAEPWPALARFAVQAKGASRVLTTLMSPPSAMAPAAGSEELRPFRTLTLTFPQALPIEQLRGMLRFDLVDLPGLADSPRRAVKSYSLALLPRSKQQDAAVYAVTLEEDVAEGKRLVATVTLSLGDRGQTLWTGALSTRTPFRLDQLQCGQAQLGLSQQGAAARERALACGNTGDGPQLVFSAPLGEVSPTTLLKLVHLSPSVPNLRGEVYGGRLSLKGRFLPDTLYKLQLAAAPVFDNDGRPLSDPGSLAAFFYLGKRSPFVRFSQGSAVLELRGPRRLPLQGEGDTRADVRIHRVDPYHPGIWPWPNAPVSIDEQKAPPFPGEEPEPPSLGGQATDLQQHLRLLGSPLVSKLVDLPLANRSGPVKFGLDLAPLLDPVQGGPKPGTYLVGLRRLTGEPQRSWVRVQVTDLSVTAAEDRDQAVVFVRRLSNAEGVKGARVLLEGTRREEFQDGRGETQWRDVEAKAERTTDGEGRANIGLLEGWTQLLRVSVQSGEDLLVLDPNDPPPQFASNHWSAESGWLGWLGRTPPPPSADRNVGFLFTERPIYRPGEKVFVKGWLRRRVGGELVAPTSSPEAALKEFGLEAEGPDGVSRPLEMKVSPLYGVDAEFVDKDPPSGRWTARLFQRQGTARVPIATRSFQIEAFRLPTFELRLSGPALARLDGPFSVKASAKFYAGGSVAQAPIRWTVTRRPTVYTPAGRAGFLFASSAQFARPRQARGSEPVRRNEKLDDQGAGELSINPGLDVDGSPRIYSFDATVQGPDGQEVNASTEVRALPPFVLGLKLPRLLREEKQLAPEVIAVGPDGKLVAGTELRVRLYARTWQSHLRESNFAGGKAELTTEQRDDLVEERTVHSDAQKPLPVPFELKAAGVYLVEVFARDKLGRVQVISADLYAAGKGAVAWQKPRDGLFTLTPDKKSYKPGETARVVIQSPFQNGRALVVTELREGNSYAWLTVKDGKAIAEIPVGLREVPNLPLHVVLMRGRIGEAKGEGGAGAESRLRPQTVGASLDLEIEPTGNLLAVTVAHPEQARPAQTIPVEVKLADDKGRPVAGEVTLWLVDEAVLSLAKEAPLEAMPAFLERNRRRTRVRDTRNVVLGRVDDEEEPGGDGADGETSKLERKRLVRKNFQTVPFWQATLPVPASGRLLVQVPLSDDLTNFKVRASAVSGLARFGYSQSVVRVRLPVIVQPVLPRLVRSGDRFWPGGLVRLVEGAEGPASAELSISGPAESKAAAQTVQLSSTIARPVSAVATVRGDLLEPTTLTVRMSTTRLSDGVGDAFEVKLPVLPDRAVEHRSEIVRFEGPNAKKATFEGFPETPRAGTAEQRIAASNVPGVLTFLAGLDALADYPHGCLEQRMSRLWPAFAHGDLLRSLGLAGERGTDGVQQARRLAEDLPAFQTESGLFGYWPGTPGDVVLTAATLQFLSAAKRNGLPVEERIRTRAVAALQAALRSDYKGLTGAWLSGAQISALRALAEAGLADDGYLSSYSQAPGHRNPTELAELLLALQARADLFAPQRDAVRAELWDRVRFKLVEGKKVYDSVAWKDGFWWYDGWLDTQVSSLGAVLEALAVADGRDPRLATLRDGLLLAASGGGGFGSTWDNRRGMTALARYLELSKEGVEQDDVALSSGATLRIDGAHKVAHVQVASPERLTATVQGKGVVARAAYRWLPDSPGDQVKALRQGFIVERSLSRVTQSGESGPAEPDARGAARRVAAGDLLEVHARLTTPEKRAQVALVVPFAAGLELLNPELENVRAEAKPSQADSITASFVQRLDGEVRYYFLELPAGTHTVHFRVRAASEGSFVQPAPWAEQMYHQEVRGRGEGARIIVTGEREK